MVTVVLYHGSHTEAHGVYLVAGTCTCADCDNDRDVWDIHYRNRAVDAGWPDPGPQPVRWVLISVDETIRLDHVDGDSFTPVRSNWLPPL